VQSRKSKIMVQLYVQSIKRGESHTRERFGVAGALLMYKMLIGAKAGNKNHNN